MERRGRSVIRRRCDRREPARHAPGASNGCDPSVMPACARPGLGPIALAFTRCSVPVCV